MIKRLEKAKMVQKVDNTFSYCEDRFTFEVCPSAFLFQFLSWPTNQEETRDLLPFQFLFQICFCFSWCFRGPFLGGKTNVRFASFIRRKYKKTKIYLSYTKERFCFCLLPP